MTNDKDLQNRFKWHNVTEEHASRMDGLRNKFYELAVNCAGQCPQSRELSLALTHLEQAMFWANAAISRNEND